MRSTHGPNRGSEERFYIGNDSGDTLWVRGGGKQSALRNPKAVSVPHLSVTVRPYTLNCREERTPGRVDSGPTTPWIFEGASPCLLSNKKDKLVQVALKKSLWNSV